MPYADDYWLARFALLRNTPLERPYANDNPNYLNDIKHNETNWAYLNTKWSGKYHSDWRVLQTNFNADYEVPFVKGLTVSGVYSYYLADYYYNNHEYTYVTYTYNPLAGKTTETDINCISTFYEYDEFLRLKCVKDQYGNIRKNYIYHLKDQL